MFGNLLSLLKLNKEKMTVLVLGLNNSGKSTIVNHFKKKNDINSYVSVPTIGFTNEEFYSQGVQFSIIDMSGAWKYRNLWQHQFKNCQGIIYVIDSSDKMRMVVVKEELNILLQHPDLVDRQTPILFYANKSDCENSLSSVNIATEPYLELAKDSRPLELAKSTMYIHISLNLTSIANKPWHISSSSAKTGDGLEEGIQWLIQHIRLKSQGSHSKIKKDKSKRK